jgi:hypothetical protein
MEQRRPAVARAALRSPRWIALITVLLLALGACSSDSSVDETDLDTAGTLGATTAPTTPAAPMSAEPDDGSPMPSVPAPTAPTAAGEPDDDAMASSTPIDVSRLESVTTVSAFDGGEGLAPWQSDVPGIEDVRIPSSADDSQQAALWLEPADSGQPLLVVLHSWSTAYLQHLGIPYGQWAEENGWGMINPNFRGVNERPEATGSDLAVSDVIDAVDYALAEGGGDPDRCSSSVSPVAA